MDGMEREADINMTTELDGSDGFDISESMENPEDMIERIVLPIICVCGIFGILLTVIVLSRKHMCTSTNCYLMALSIADLLFLILLATTLAEYHLVPDSNAYYTFEIYKVYAIIFMHSNLMASIWLTVMLAIERYIAICRPFLAAKMCRVKYARTIIFSIFLVTFICRLPNFWEHKLLTVRDPSTNTTLIYLHLSSFYDNKAYVTIYPWVVDGILSSFIPFLLLLVLNARLIWEVRKSTRYLQRNLMVAHNTNSTAHKEEMQITIMLISVIIVFFICQAPYVIYAAIVGIAKHSTSLLIFKDVARLLLTLKSAINFILYCWFSEKFWLTLQKTFCMVCCLKLKGNSQNGSYYNLRRHSNCITRDTVI